ncbi:HTH domain-containing protein [Breznakia pachnodae]|uniref:Transcriptional antiterminator n=1 Tax=Breznakia pachnodae TaxID=265178 RepID=A0ABU0E4G0_9FIRM|nr:HTH domain-containing protein [Breznakia pachnodae]MDQ0361801.1 transcriptional antiterminator [Breznakia pachnodae]
MNKREKGILLYLCENELSTSEAMAKEFQVTTRTIRNDIKMLNEQASENGFEILSKSGIGYSMNITDLDCFQQFCDEIDEKSIDIPVTSEDRIA